MSHSIGNGIEDLYQSVINDVISQCKEAFMDENVDVEILYQIKKSWEEKVNESGAVDLHSKSQTIPLTRPPPQKPGMPGKPGPSGVQGYLEAGASTSDPQSMNQFINPDYLSSANVNLIPQMQYSQAAGLQQFVLANGQQLSGNVMMVPVSIDGSNVVQLTPEQIKNARFFPQVDGNSADYEGLDLKGKPSDYTVDLDMEKGELTIRKKKKNSDKHHIKMISKELKDLSTDSDEDEKRKKLLGMLPQVDGGPTMSDSSSESEEDEDEHISRIVERIEEKTEAEEDDGGDEEPLNSDDDQSDDEDLDTLFESSNIIVCQFEKVNRARTKWKFNLKDGIMHINGKDYCFQKCSGEAEW